MCKVSAIGSSQEAVTEYVPALELDTLIIPVLASIESPAGVEVNESGR